MVTMFISKHLDIQMSEIDTHGYYVYSEHLILHMSEIDTHGYYVYL